MSMKVKEVADLVGVSIRTLHHYHEIGLLTPTETTDSGYRLYSEDDLAKLQQILFFKELGFSLKEIKNMMSNPAYDRLEALVLQRKMLEEKRKRFAKMIAAIDKTIQHMKGEIEMTNEERFAGLTFRHNPYEEEARKRWGDESVNQAQAKLAGMSDDELQGLAEKWEMIFRQLAQLRQQSPESPDVQTAIKAWYDFLNENFAQYSLEAFAGLGQLYVDDPRFTQNIDKYGEGLAEFMSKAMKVFAEKNR